jgi:flap endonuclease-1
LVYGASLLRGLTNRGTPLVQVSGTEIRNALGLSQDSFIDFALLLGSDFSERLHGLGPHTAIKLLSQTRTIEGLLAHERNKPKGRKYLPEPKVTETQYLNQIELGREVFRNLPPVTDEIREQAFQIRHFDERAVHSIMKAFDLEWAYGEDKQFDYNMMLDRDFFTGQASLGGALVGNYL